MLINSDNHELQVPKECLSEVQASREIWLRALNFSERVALSGRTHLSPLTLGKSRKRAWDRIGWWGEQLKRTPASVLHHRCFEFNVSTELALELTGASGKDLLTASGPLPAWVCELEDILNSYIMRASSEAVKSAGEDGTQFLISPWIKWASRRFEKWIEKSSIASDSRVATEKLTTFLLPSLAERLRLILERTFVLEFNVARARRELRGKTIEEQIVEFGTGFKLPSKTLALLKEYPVLARILTDESIQWLRYASELATRLSSDWDAIQSAFFDGQCLGKLTNIRIGVGDRHCGGQSVSLVHFDNGKCVVYKPRPLKVEVLFKELLAFLDKYSDGLPLFFPRVLDCGQYGWSEFVSYASCPDEAALSRFYRRAGKLLCITFVLGAADLHWGNVIACGDQPVAIDLECLYQPWRPHLNKLSALDRVRSNTVLGTTLLPGRPLGGVDGSSLSGLSEVHEGMLFPYRILRKRISDADGLRLVHEIAVHRGGAANLPAHDGNGKRPFDFLPSLLQGFRECAATFIHCKKDLVASSIWHSLCEQRYRYVAQATPNYARLLMNSYHPNVLRDAMDRESIFDELWRGTRVPEEVAKLMVASEREDLWGGDVPMFLFCPRGTGLWDSQDRLVWSCAGKPVNAAVEERLLSLDSHIVDRNAWVIQTAYEATYAGRRSVASSSLPKWRFSAASAGTDAAVFAGLAKQVADRILELGFPDSGRLCWIDTCQIAEESKIRYYAGVVNEDLYSGLSGFLLFFHYAARVLQEARFEKAAEAITSTLLESLRQRLPNGPNLIGGFSGRSSILYALTHRLGSSATPFEIVEGCDRLLDLIERSVSEDETFDIIGGSAGAICLLLGYHSITNNSRCVDLAEKCGSRLLERALVQRSGVAWKTIGDVPCCGFAHGTSGIAYSLFRLAAATKKEKYAVAARQATRYTQSLYSVERRNWLDLRPSSHTHDTVAWCYGAPGIGLALAAQIWLGFGDASCYGDLELAFERTINARCDKHNLCHGAFGYLECLVSMARATANPAWRNRALHLAMRLIDEAVEKGLTYDSDSVTLNLMLGLAGIGCALLRLADSERVPSILLLESPRRLNPHMPAPL